ncbi:hypothetical protein [Spiroplasma endosymbiont of Glossina fuscipes fuscipes]|uniref:hypothetical protein n=1 Tax=Spiroplasma endosymbiont of Glossina fuscipes fuscipes TaxID=2004463 RepID=UPI003C71B450
MSKYANKDWIKKHSKDGLYLSYNENYIFCPTHRKMLKVVINDLKKLIEDDK